MMGHHCYTAGYRLQWHHHLMGTGSCPRCFTSHSTLPVGMGKQQKMAQVFGPLPLDATPEYWLLASPSPALGSGERNMG